jgi:hypothetical protein
MTTTSIEKLAYIIVKAREYDAEMLPEGLEDGSNAADDQQMGILESTPDNPTRAELRAALEGLNEDELIEVLALTWLGRADYAAEEWPEALTAARAAHDERAVSYLMETPNLGDLLEEGLAALDISIIDEEGRL